MVSIYWPLPMYQALFSAIYIYIILLKSYNIPVKYGGTQKLNNLPVFIEFDIIEQGLRTRKSVSRSYAPNDGPLIYNGGNSRIQQDLGLRYVWALFPAQIPGGLSRARLVGIQCSSTNTYGALSIQQAPGWVLGYQDKTRSPRNRGAESCGPRDRTTNFSLRVIKFVKKAIFDFETSIPAPVTLSSLSQCQPANYAGVSLLKGFLTVFGTEKAEGHMCVHRNQTDLV